MSSFHSKITQIALFALLRLCLVSLTDAVRSVSLQPILDSPLCDLRNVSIGAAVMRFEEVAS